MAKKIIERFGFGNSDSKLDDFKIGEGNPIVKKINDGVFGYVLKIDSQFRDAMDFKVKPSGEFAKEVSYVYIPGEKFTFYVYVRLMPKNKSSHRIVYIAITSNVALPQKTYADESEYPVRPKIFKNDWLINKINLTKMVQQTYGDEGYEYEKILGLRIRGAGKVAKIELR